MTSTEVQTVGPVAHPLKRYRLPGIEREGIAQLSLLETALWPLQGGKLTCNRGLLKPLQGSSTSSLADSGRERKGASRGRRLVTRPIRC